MLTPFWILVVLALLFLALNAANKMPAWPWGLCLFLIVLLGR